MKDSFAAAVQQGLSASPRHLPSRYLFDEKGNALFAEVRTSKDYYLDRCERSLLQAHAGDIARRIPGKELTVFEFGAGEGNKTTLLLQSLLDSGKNLHYTPVDLSRPVLKLLEKNLNKRIPALHVEPFHGEFGEMLARMAAEETDIPRLILLLGPVIGGYTSNDALCLLKQIARVLNPGDMLLLGADMKKSPSVILPAYTDSGGVYADFTRNMLERINRELGGHFKAAGFRHYASYEPDNGEMRSYLISQKDQEVLIEKLNKSYHFKKWENVHVEVAKKYSKEELTLLLEEAGFATQEVFYDSEYYFMDALAVYSG